ncbi:MAG: OmpH family outer membrane protein [Alphaproteobacteria bacterium]
MTTTLRTLALAGLAACALTPVIWATPVLADPPQPKIVVIDRAGIMRFSKVGQDVAKQMQAAAAQAKADLSGQAKSIQNEERTLQQQVAILAPDVKAKKLAAFQARAASLQGAAQRKDDQLKAAFAQAQKAMEDALGPILQNIVKQRGANMVLDKQAVVFATQNGFDITADVINQLNQKLPAYKINLNAGTPKK